jgi:hypothetical protein
MVVEAEAGGGAGRRSFVASAVAGSREVGEAEIRTGLTGWVGDFFWAAGWANLVEGSRAEPRA